MNSNYNNLDEYNPMNNKQGKLECKSLKIFKKSNVFPQVFTPSSVEPVLPKPIFSARKRFQKFSRKLVNVQKWAKRINPALEGIYLLRWLIYRLFEFSK